MYPSFIKFVLQDKYTNNTHWDYCCENKIPYLSIIKAGSKYWKVEFDVASVTQNKRFVIIDYCDHIIPLYELYCDYSKFPSNKKSYAGGGRNLVFTVFKKDAVEIADKLFDLLFLLSKQDQELFDENPIEVNSEGVNSEGTQVERFGESLKRMNNEKLGFEYKMMLFNNPSMVKTIKLIQDEVDLRKI